MYEKVVVRNGLVLESNLNVDSPLLSYLIGHRDDKVLHISDNVKTRVLTSWNDLNQDDFAEEAWTLSYLLPGGVQVLGICIIEPNELSMENEIESTAANIFTKINIPDECDDEYFSSLISRPNYYLLVYINQKSKIQMFKVYDEHSKKWKKITNSPSKVDWVSIEARCELSNFVVKDSKNASEQLSIGQNLESSIRQLVDTYEIVFDDLCSESIITLEKCWKSKNNALELPRQCLIGSFYAPSDTHGQDTVERTCKSLSLTGTFLCNAYLPLACTLKQAEESLKFDMIHCIRNSLLTVLDKPKGGVYKIPSRLRISSRKGQSEFYAPVPVNESLTCVKETYSQILGFDVDIHELDRECKLKSDDNSTFKDHLTRYQLFIAASVLLVLYFLYILIH